MLKSLFKFAVGLAIGAAVGAAAARMLAPASGEELIEQARSYRDQVIQAGKEAEEQRRIELESRFAQAKQFKPAPPVS